MLAAICLLAVASCTTEYYGYSENYINAYITPSEATVNVTKWGVFVEFSGYTCTSGTAYEDLANKFGDIHYDKSNHSESTGAPRTAMNDSVLEAKMTAIDEFDEKHAAGSDVSDLVNVKYSTFTEFISNGYNVSAISHDDRDAAFHKIYYYDGATLHQKKLTELTSSDTRLIFPTLMFVFSQQPQQKGAHKLRLTLKTSHMQVDEEFEYTF